MQAFDPAIAEAAALAARGELWRRGALNFKRHEGQRLLHEAIVKSASLLYYVSCSRRFGKSTELVLYAFETCLSKPNARVLYLAPWAKDAADIAGDIAERVLLDCPADVRPKYNAQSKEYEFPNGSVIRFKGTNGEHAKFLRGGSADLVLLDEPGDMDNLRHVVFSICMPMTMTTKGKIIIAGTPAVTPGHESHTIYERLAGEGNCTTFNIRDMPHVDVTTKAMYLVEAGEKVDDVYDILAGIKDPVTTTAQREYFCWWVTDASKAVVREFDEAARKDIVKEWARPDYFDTYVSMDPGFADRTGILFGYWDYFQEKLVIEDELLLHQAGTPDLAREIKATEARLWNEQKPYSRLSDVEPRLVSDLWNLYQLSFTPVTNKDVMGDVAWLRQMVSARKLVIHPRCEHLVRQLREATWNNKATDFERTEKHGHYDLVAALKYLCRNIVPTHNPYPAGWFHPGKDVFTSPRWKNPLRNKSKLDELNKRTRSATPFGRRIMKKKKNK